MTETAGQLPPKWVVRLIRNGWSASPETAGQIQPKYALTLEGKRIVFRPTSILNPYDIEFASGPRPATAILTHFRDAYGGVTPDEILELEDLINNPHVIEEDFQSFFEGHPHLLRMWDHRAVHPHVYLTRDDQGPLIPDFILVDAQLQRAMLLDLKRPDPTIVVRKHNRERFSALIDEARAQLLEYRDWFESPDNRNRVKSVLGMEVFRPRLGVVVGMSDQFRGDLDRQKLVSRYPDVDVITYDDIVKHAERRLMLVKSALR